MVHNDCMHVAHALTGVAMWWRALGVDADQACMVCLSDDIRACAVRIMTYILDAHKARIGTLLGGFLQGVSEGRGDEDAAMGTLRSGIDGIKKFAEDVMWQNMPLYVYRRAVADVLDMWYRSVAAAVLTMRDIPSREVRAMYLCV